MSRLSRSGTLRASSSVSPPSSSPLRPTAFSKSTSPSSPSPLSGIFSPHKRKEPPLSTAAEYEGIEEEDEDVSSSSGDSADDVDGHSSFAAEYAANGHSHSQLQRTVASPPTSTGLLSPSPAQAAVRASALTAALSAVRNVSPSSYLSASLSAVSPSKQMIAIAARPVSPAANSPYGSFSTAAASAPLPATVLRDQHATAASMELDDSEDEKDAYGRAQSSPPPYIVSPPSASLEWPPAPSESLLSDPSLLPSLRMSMVQRQRLANQLSQHVEQTLALRRLLRGSTHSAVNGEAVSTMYRKATELLSSLCAVRMAHQRLYTQHTVLDVPQLDGLQQRLSSAAEEAWPASTYTGSTSGVVAVQPAIAATVVPKGTAGATRAAMAGVVTATAVGGSPQFASSTWPGGAAIATVLPGQPVMATIGTATPAAAYGAAARLLSHSSAPAASKQPIAARLVQPAQRSASNAVMASSAASSSAHTVAASPAAGSLTSALSSLSSSLASFANSPQHTRSPTPLMASLSLHPPQTSSPGAPVTATVMAAASPATPSSFSFSPTSFEHSVTAVTASAASPASGLSASLARSSISPASNVSPSPGQHSMSVVPAVAISPDGTHTTGSPNTRVTPVSSSFSAQSELSSLDSFASLALASFSPTSAASPLADNALTTLASLAHTDSPFNESSLSVPSNPQPTHSTAPTSASSRSSSYRSSDQPNKRSRSQSQHEPDVITVTTAGASGGLAPARTLRKNRSQQGLSKLDTPRTASPLPGSGSHPRLPSSASFNSLSSVVSSAASSPSPTSPLPASGSFPAAVPASVISNHSPRRRTYSPRSSGRRVVAASVVLPATVTSEAPNGDGGDGVGTAGLGLLSPSSMQVVAALWSGHDESNNRPYK